MPLINAKCTSCGAAIEVDPSKEAQICQYCGSAFIVEKAINNYNITNNVTNNIQAENVTIVNQSGNTDFEIVAGKLIKYNGASIDVVIPDGVEVITKGAFPDGVKSITFPPSVTSIENNMFRDCINLTSIEILSSVISIGESAFRNCINLTSIKLVSGVVSISESVFEGCTSLTSVIIPSSVISIKDRAFYGCTSLSNVTIPESVTSIGPFAFYDCKNLNNITIPSNVTSIGKCAFDGCTNLSNVEINGIPQMDPIGSFDSPFRRTPYEAKNISKQNKNTGGCYVATCVYGSYDCPQVWTLRRYRDYTLAEKWYGRAFIHIYYMTSPFIVKLFGGTKWFKKIWRVKLDKLVASLQARGIENTPYKDRNWY